MLLLVPSLGVYWMFFLEVSLTLGSPASLGLCATCSPSLGQNTLLFLEAQGVHFSHLPPAFLVQGSL